MKIDLGNERLILLYSAHNENTWHIDTNAHLIDSKTHDLITTNIQYLHSRIIVARCDKQLMSTIGEQSRKNGQFNIAFLTNFVLGKLDECLDILIENQRLPDGEKLVFEPRTLQCLSTVLGKNILK